MSAVIASTPYFYTGHLQSGFAANLAQAVSDGRIVDDESRQLEKLLGSARSANLTDSGLRVDRLIVEDGQTISDELAGALLISEEDGGSTHLYLDTLLFGLERFDDRTALLGALNRYTPAASKPAFEYLLVDGEPFEQRMRAIIDQQVEHLRQLAQRLQRIPTLESALTESLKQLADAQLPEANIDLSLPLTQMLRVNATTGAQRMYNQTLVEAAMDVLVGERQVTNRYRAYLGPRGEMVDATQARRYDKLLADAVKRLTVVYESLLGDYWHKPNQYGETPRILTALALASGFRQALLAGKQNGNLGAGEFAALGNLLHPEKAAYKSALKTQRLSLVIGHQPALKLVGLFLITGGPVADLLLYSAQHGIRRFPTAQAMLAYFSTAAGRTELQLHVSLNDVSLLGAAGVMRIEPYDIEHPLFMDCVDSIIGLQRRNLAYVLGRTLNDVPAARAMIDDALDVSGLIDRRLALFDGGGRWAQADVPFVERWPVHRTAPDTGAGGGEPTLNPTWAEQISGLGLQVQWLTSTYPGIEAYARQRLNQYLAVFDQPGLDALEISVVWPQNSENSTSAQAASTDVTSAPVKLVDLLLEKFSGYRATGIPRETSIVKLASGEVLPQPFARLSVEFINQMVERIASELHEDYLKQVRDFYAKPLRLAQQQVSPADACHGYLQNALRLECELQERVQPQARTSIQMLEQVLSRPVRSLRDSLTDDVVEVYSAALVYAKGQPAAPISNMFILRRPLHTRGQILCWSALRGIELFDSLQALGQTLNLRFATRSRRERWLGLLSERDQLNVRAHLDHPTRTILAIDYTRIDGHFILALQQMEHSRQRSNVEQALHAAVFGAMPAKVLARFILVAQQDERMSYLLDGLSTDIQAVILQGMLPSWLKEASPADLTAYIELLQRHYLSNDPAEDFLVSMPSLQAFARGKILSYFDADYPGQMPDPDLITVTFTAYVSTPVAPGDTPSGIAAATLVKHESFTEFSLNHFNNVQGAVLVVKLPDDLPIPQFVPPGYFKTLVRTLDIGQQYRTLLADRLVVGSDSYALARSRFIAQMPSRMLLLAVEMKMQKQLSAQGFGYLRNVLEMPDGIARQADDEDVTLRPMQLLAATGMTADPVPGVYLIGPRDVSKGPIVVHALFNEAFSFKEYASQVHLLRDLQTPGELQTLVLGRVDPLVRKRYDHGGFSEAHIPWSSEGFLDGPVGSAGPVTLINAPVTGNALQYLFAETMSVFKDICRKQTVTTAEADWKSLVYLMSLGVDQVLSFVPGKLGMLLAAWQSKELFKASVTSAYDRRWGRALSEITAALGTLLSTRHGSETQEQVGEEPVAEKPSQAAPMPEFSWKNSALTAQLKTRLRALQISDIALSELQHDRLYNIYKDPATLKQYAAIAGQVYEVTSTDAQWRIVGPNGQGPNIRLNAAQQWELNLRLGLMGGGGQVTKLQSLQSRDNVDRVLLIEASGMGEIRALYQQRASMIIEAHIQARRYLENCLYNLVPNKVGGSIHGHTSRQIADFFGTGWAPPQLIALIQRKVTRLYLGLTDPSLSSLVSNRFVVGINKPGQERTAAFVSMSDPQKRIYLTEGFFDTPDFLLKSNYSHRGGFDSSSHYRAATLLHELSHLVNHTHDYAYLDASLPFVDMLDVSGPGLKKIRDELNDLRTSALSHRTPANRLFRKQDSTGWRDITESEGKSTVLRLTETTTLAAARNAFFTDPRMRSEVMLSNADSLTMLIMELGRQRLSPDFDSNVSIGSIERLY